MHRCCFELVPALGFEAGERRFGARDNIAGARDRTREAEGDICFRAGPPRILDEHLRARGRKAAA